MGRQVKVSANTSAEVFVGGLGGFTPGKWRDVTDEQAALFEQMHGVSLEESTLEVRTAPKSKKKEDD
jgi:hypothetical protein